MSNLLSQLLVLVRNLLVEVRTANFKLFRLQEKVEAITEQQQAKKNSHDERLSPIVSVLTTPRAIRVDAETRERKNRWQKVLEVLEPIGIVAVVPYAIINYHMLREMRHANETAHQQFTSNLQQANAASQNAQASLDATVDQFRLDQRARISVNSVQAPQFKVGDKMLYLKAGEKPQFAATIANSGKTPARNVQLSAGYISLEKHVKSSAVYDRGDEIKSKAVLAPGPLGGIIQTNAPQDPITQPFTDSIETGDSILYFFGEIRYQDVFFPRTHEHTTVFCAFLSRSLDGFRACKTYNDEN